MNNNFLNICIVLILLGCNTNKEKGNNKDYPVTKNNSVNIDNDLINIKSKLKKSNTDTIKNDTIFIKESKQIEISQDSLFSLSFLRKNATEIKLNFEECFDANYFYTKNFKLNLERYLIKDFTDELFTYIVFFYKNNNKIFQKAFFCVDESDITLSLISKNKCFYLLEFYSEPVGYFEYYIFDPVTEGFFRTDKIDEAKNIDIESIDLKKGKYMLKDDQEIYDLIIERKE